MDDTEDSGDLPMDSRFVVLQSQATVKGPIDAIVELVTNSEDAYVRMGSTGDILVFMKSLGKGRKAVLGVRDDATGMTYEQLLEGIVYGGRTSGQKAGSGIRGILGRGMKEAILGLGMGSVITVKDGAVSYAEIYPEPEDRNRPKFFAQSDPPTRKLKTDLANNTGLEFPANSGTIVLVRIREDFRVPREATLLWQIQNHYALRKILEKTDRKVKLTYQDSRANQRTHVVKREMPRARKVLEKDIEVGDTGSTAHLVIYEAEECLDTQRTYGMTYSNAGILVTTEGIVLDNRLWAFEHENAGYFFYGELDVPFFGLLLEQEDTSFLTPQRTGLDWRSPLCRAIEKACVKELGPFVHRKKEELSKPSSSVGEERKSQFTQVCKVLNELAEEYESDYEATGPGGIEPSDLVKEMVVIPAFVRVHPDQVRALSVYVPRHKLPNGNSTVAIRLDGAGISLLDKEIEVAPIAENQDLFYGYFRVVGKILGQTVTVTASLNGARAYSVVEVTQEEKRGRKKKTRAGRRGPFSEIVFDQDPNPIQPVFYDASTGAIRVFCGFPSVKMYIGPDGAGLERSSGRTLFAELVGEAFCRQLARRGIETGKYPANPGAEIDNYESAFNDHRRRALHIIHREVGRIISAI